MTQASNLMREDNGFKLGAFAYSYGRRKRDHHRSRALVLPLA